MPRQAAERIGFLTGTFLGYSFGVLSLIFAPLIIFGAIRMLKGEKYGMARTSAILSVIPLSCCFPLSIIFGIWSLVVLSKTDVKDAFQGRSAQPNFPPQPPQSW